MELLIGVIIGFMFGVFIFAVFLTYWLQGIFRWW